MAYNANGSPDFDPDQQLGASVVPPCVRQRLFSICNSMEETHRAAAAGSCYAPAGMNNLTVTYNWFYGNSAIQAATQQADSFIWLDGSSVIGSTRTQ